MQLSFHNSWLKLVLIIRVFPPMVPLRRYRVAPAHFAFEMQRRSLRQIRRKLRSPG
jgi:hypothetical protein